MSLFVDLNLEASHKFALENTIVVFSCNWLFGIDGLRTFLFAKNIPKTSKNFTRQRINKILHLIIAVIEPQQQRIILSGHIGIDEITDIPRIPLQLETLGNFIQPKDIEVAPLELSRGIKIS